MDVRNRGSYPLEKRELVAEGSDLRVQILTLAAGQCVPWHRHSEVTDSFVCLEGPMVIETRGPEQKVTLAVGERFAVPAGTAHKVSGQNDGRCRFLIAQGTGAYDFIREPDAG